MATNQMSQVHVVEGKTAGANQKNQGGGSGELGGMPFVVAPDRSAPMSAFGGEVGKLVLLEFDGPKGEPGKVSAAVGEVVSEIAVNCLGAHGMKSNASELDKIFVQLVQKMAGIPQGEVLTTNDLTRIGAGKLRMDNLNVQDIQALQIALNQYQKMMAGVTGFEIRGEDAKGRWERFEDAVSSIGIKLKIQGRESRVLIEKNKLGMIRDEDGKKRIAKAFAKLTEGSSLQMSEQDLGASMMEFVAGGDLEPEERTRMQERVMYNTDVAVKLLESHLKDVGVYDRQIRRLNPAVTEQINLLKKDPQYADWATNPTTLRMMELDAAIQAVHEVNPGLGAESMLTYERAQGMSPDRLRAFKRDVVDTVSKEVPKEKQAEKDGVEAELKKADDALLTASRKLEGVEEALRAFDIANLEAQQARLFRESADYNVDVHTHDEIAKLEAQDAADGRTLASEEKRMRATDVNARCKKEKADLDRRLAEVEGKINEFPTKIKSLKEEQGVAEKEKKHAGEDKAKAEAKLKEFGVTVEVDDKTKEAAKELWDTVQEGGKKNEYLLEMMAPTLNLGDFRNDPDFHTLRALFHLGANFNEAMGEHDEKWYAFLIKNLGIRDVDIALVQAGLSARSITEQNDQQKAAVVQLIRAQARIIGALQVDQKSKLMMLADRAWVALMDSSMKDIVAHKMSIDSDIDTGMVGIAGKTQFRETGRPDVSVKILEKFDIYPGVNALAETIQLDGGEQIYLTVDPATGENVVINGNGEKIGSVEVLNRIPVVGKKKLERIKATTTGELKDKESEIFRVLGLARIKAELDKHTENEFDYEPIRGLGNVHVVRVGGGYIIVYEHNAGGQTIKENIPWNKFILEHAPGSLGAKAREEIGRIEEASNALNAQVAASEEMRNEGELSFIHGGVPESIVRWDDRDVDHDPFRNPNLRSVWVDFTTTEPDFQFHKVEIRDNGPEIYRDIQTGQNVHFAWVQDNDSGFWNLADLRPRRDGEKYPSGITAPLRMATRRFFRDMYFDMVDSWDTVKGYKEAFINVSIPINGQNRVFGRGKDGKLVVWEDGITGSNQVEAFRFLNDGLLAGTISTSTLRQIQEELGYNAAMTRYQLLNRRTDIGKP